MSEADIEKLDLAVERLKSGKHGIFSLVDKIHIGDIKFVCGAT